MPSSSTCEFRRVSTGGEVVAGNLKAGGSGMEPFRLSKCAPGPGVFGSVLVPVYRRGVFGTDEFGGSEEPISGEGCGGILELSGAIKRQ